MLKKSIVSFILVILISPLYGYQKTEEAYEGLKTLWEKHKESESYNSYLIEFVQWSNSFELDTRYGCHDESLESVTLFLLVTDKGVIESVKSNNNTEKALCFKKTYKGLKVKKPPFSPLVIKMDF